MPTNRLALCTVMLASMAVPAHAQTCPSPPKTYQDHWCAKIAAIAAIPKAALDRQSQVEDLINLQSDNLGPFLLYAQARSKSVDVRQLEDARLDKQIGSPGNSPGSPNAVSKGAVPAVLGFAVENGALTQAITGTTTTFRGNLVGWLDLLHDQGFIAAYEDDSTFVRQLRRVSYSFTLNTDTKPSVDTSASGLGGFSPAALREQLKQTAEQLTSYSARVAIWDQRDPRVTANRAAVATMLDTQGRAFLNAIRFVDPALNSDEYSRRWIPDTASILKDPALTTKQIEKLLYQRLELIRVFMSSHIDNFDEQVTKALLALEGFNQARVKVFQAMQKRPLVAFEYVNARDKILPDLSTLRAIVEGQWGPRVDLTANVAWTLQGAGTVTAPETQPLDGGLRDFQAAAQLEVPLKSAQSTLLSTSGIGTPVFGIAYLSQKLTQKSAISFAGRSFTLEPGWIHVVQARLTIPVKNSGMKIPLSLSVANRSDLIKEKTVRAHFGVTFDMDVLSALRR
jgi:hypothetical protein